MGILDKQEKGNAADILQRAFEDAFGVLGENTIQSIIYELKIQAGVDLNDPSLTLVKLHDAIASLYGAETAEVFMEELLVKMDRIAAEDNQ